VRTGFEIGVVGKSEIQAGTHLTKFNMPEGNVPMAAQGFSGTLSGEWEKKTGSEDGDKGDEQEFEQVHFAMQLKW
jgi:hypothetical protein